VDYGERQARALEIINRCRSRPDKDAVAFINSDGTKYSYAQIADEIEQMTDIGRETMAVAGLVIQAAQTSQFEVCEVCGGSGCFCIGGYPV